jgi:hypothetical protein
MRSACGIDSLDEESARKHASTLKRFRQFSNAGILPSHAGRKNKSHASVNKIVQLRVY